MANPWFRLWADMVNDPKWRTIARHADQKIGDVVAVFVHMMTCASNATERGRTQGWCDEDVATALDLKTDQVAAIRAAMQGRVLDGDYLLGWEKRQPVREDGSSERGKQHREVERLKKELELLKNELIQTQPNATERNRTENALDKIRVDKENKEPSSDKAPDVAPGGAVRKVTPTEEDFKAARWLFKQVLAVNPTAKPPNPSAWATDVRLMRERDGRTHKEICELFQWAKADSFWAPNIQSPSKLREKWDILTEKRAQPVKTGKSAAWWASEASIRAKCQELSLTEPQPGESTDAILARIRAAIDNGGVAPVQRQSRVVVPLPREPKGVKPAGMAPLASMIKIRGDPQ